MGNRKRIVEMCLDLMNEEGSRAVGTSRIADELGISPGNLYYHFKNREEIVMVIYEDLDADFRAALVEDVHAPISPECFAGFFLRTLQVAWEYRFFFGGMLHLLRRDEELAARYAGLQAWAIDTIEGILKQLIKDRSLTRPKAKTGLRSMAINLWIVWSNWIRFIQVSDPSGEVRRDHLIQGVGQLLDILAPYLDPSFEKAGRRVLTRELKKFAEEAADPAS